MVCRYCGHGRSWPFGKNHYPECAFSTARGVPMREMKNQPPPIIIDPFLATREERKELEKEFNEGKWRRLPDGNLQRIFYEIDWPRAQNKEETDA